MRSHYALSAVVTCALAATACAKSSGPVVAGDSGAVPISVGSKGFEPSAVKFKKGSAATLVFTRTTDDTCATEVVFPQLSITKELPKDTPVTVTIPTEKEQTLTFQCGMGMYKSSVVVAVN